MSIDLELTPKQKRPAGEPCCEPLVHPDVGRDEAGAMAAIAKALGDPVRIQLVDVLRKHAGKVCVCELVPLFDIGQSTLSHHLKRLRDAGLVDSERQGLWAYYYVRPEALAPLAGWLGDPQPSTTRDAVRARYTAAAVGRGAACCGPEVAAHGDRFGAALYGADEHRALPDAAVQASLGCGNPTAVAELHEGETVLDLGSGGGIDVLLSARRVGPTGKAYGLDELDEMLALARSNQREAGVENVEWLKGDIGAIPLPAGTVDVVISNCVINLAADKRQVLREAARVLKPGGRFAVSDVIADPDMDDATKTDMAAWTGCIAGALTRDQFVAALTAAGLTDIDITETHRVHEHAGSAIVRARKPDTGCCDTDSQAVCCEPAAKSTCCSSDATADGGCGCA